MTAKKGRIGSDFDDFLKDEGLYEEVTASVVEQVLTQQTFEAMKVGEMNRKMDE